MKIVKISRAEADKIRIAHEKKVRERRRANSWNASPYHAARKGICGGVPELNHPPHFGDDANVDHIIPRSLGGSNDELNLRSVCLPIHDELNKVLAQLRKNFYEDDRLEVWVAWQRHAGVAGVLVDKPCET